MSTTTAKVNVFLRPVFYKATQGEEPTKENIARQYNSLNPKPSLLKTMSYGEYTGITATVLGGLGVLFGFKTDSSFQKKIFSVLATVGLAVAAAGRLLGVDLSAGENKEGKVSADGKNIEVLCYSEIKELFSNAVASNTLTKDMLMQYVEHPDAQVKTNIVNLAVFSLKKEEAKEVLLKLCEDSDFEVKKCVALNAATHLKGKEMEEVLLKLCKDSNPEVRRFIVWEIGALTSEERETVALILSSDPDPQVSSRAQSLLKEKPE